MDMELNKITKTYYRSINTGLLAEEKDVHPSRRICNCPLEKKNGKPTVLHKYDCNVFIRVNRPKSPSMEFIMAFKKHMQNASKAINKKYGY